MIQLFTMFGIFLIGFMGAGKSSVGQALARHLDRPFIDLDERLVERFGMSIPRVFCDHGETAFRSAERAELAAAAADRAAVVATGGGTFCSRENREIIRAAGGLSVFLDLPWDVLDHRLSNGGDQRPLYVDAVQARELFEDRMVHYRKASTTLTLDGDESLAEVVRRVADVVSGALCAI